MKPLGARRLAVVDVPLEDANRFILEFHRHHLDLKPGIGRYALAAVDETGLVRGVAVVGMPAALNRKTNQSTLEVSRVATDGSPNACSLLYGACARAAKALGFSEIITYILEDEPGTSLKASGWTQDPGTYGGVGWANRPGRRDGHPVGPKGRWRLTIRSPRPVVWPAMYDPAAAQLRLAV